MYGLVQAAIIVHDALKEDLKPYGYALANITQGLCTHTHTHTHTHGYKFYTSGGQLRN